MKTAEQRDAFETVFARTTAGFFLREFCFTNTEFSPPGRSEVELADFVIQLDNLTFVFQVKNRQEPSEDPRRERTWFEDKVIKRATRQVRDTITHLQTCNPEIVNDRGRRVAFSEGLDINSITKVVIFKNGPALPLDCARSRFHRSKTAGFIHLIAAPDWSNILETLVTPREIVDYLQMRERLSVTSPAQVRSVSEKALVGQFIADAENAPPSSTFEKTVDRLIDDRPSFDILRFLNLFGDRLTLDSPPNTQTPSDLRDVSTDYYAIVREIAKLPRTDLAAFKERFDLAWRKAGKDTYPPFTRMVSSTGVGFVFVPVPSGLEPNAQNGLANFIHAHMYERRVAKCIGAAFIQEGPKNRFVWWMMTERTWEYNSEMETLLQERDGPLSAVRETVVPRYRLDDR